MSDPPRKNGEPSALRAAGLLLAIPTLLIVAPIVGFFVGSLADRWLRLAPWCSIVGLFLGFAAAGRETYLIYRRYMEEEERKKRR